MLVNWRTRWRIERRGTSILSQKDKLIELLKNNARLVVDKYVGYTKLDQVSGGKTVASDTTKYYLTQGHIS